VDRRIVDDLVAAQWMAAFVRRVENPAELMA
jgi:hypothetical protein